MEFDLEDSGGKGEYTIFIERESCRMFALTEPPLKEEAARLWRYVELLFSSDHSAYCLQRQGAALPSTGGSSGFPGTMSSSAGFPNWPPSLSSMQDSCGTLSSLWTQSFLNGPASPALAGPVGGQYYGPLSSSSSLSGWSTVFSSGVGSNTLNSTPTASWGSQSSTTSVGFDSKDRLNLGDGLFLIRGEDAFFLEFASTGLDIPVESISMSFMMSN